MNIYQGMTYKGIDISDYSPEQAARAVLNRIQFFKPNSQFAKWILEYANGRLIIDAGCGGEFPLTQQLISLGVKNIVAIDPFIDDTFLDFYRAKNYDLFLERSIHILTGTIQQFAKLTQVDKDILIIFARPCHSNFVYETLKFKGDRTEVMYITKPKNLELYDDLGEYQGKAVLLQHEGSSADNEVVYSIF